MASTVVTRMWRPTTPESMEPELVALWREVAREHRVARAVMSNLIVFRERTRTRGDDFDSLTEGVPVADVASRHPSRVIVISHDCVCYEQPVPLGAGIGVITFGPPHAQYAVEVIAIHSACDEQPLASIVRRLVRGDVPTSLWWTEDISETAPFRELLPMTRQLVYDSRDWRDAPRAVAILSRLRSSAPRLDLADTNWRRLTAMRQALLHASTLGALDGLARGDVRLVHRPGDGMLAWLMVGWLGARLRWPTEVAPPIEEAESGDDMLTLVVGRGGGEVTAAMNAHRVAVTPSGAAPFTIAIPQESEAEAVAAELRNLSHDVCLHEALDALGRIFACRQ